MIRGYVFANQLASNEVDSMIFRKMLDYNDGIFKGMELSNTATTITVHEGIIMMAGRPVGIIGNESIVAGTDTAFCKLVLEIDLSKESSESNFEQVALKIIKSTTTYPNVTQEDMDNDGIIYQVELARFKTGLNGITEFTDTRKFLDFKAIYSSITEEYRSILKNLEEELKDVEDGSAFVLKVDYDEELTNLQKKIKIVKELPQTSNEGDIFIQYFD